MDVLQADTSCHDFVPIESQCKRQTSRLLGNAKNDFRRASAAFEWRIDEIVKLAKWQILYRQEEILPIAGGESRGGLADFA